MTFPTTYCIHCPETTEPPNRAGLVAEHFAEHNLPVTFVRGVHGRTWGLDTRLWHHRDSAARAQIIEGCRQVAAIGEGDASDEHLLHEVYNRPLCGYRDAYRIDAGHIGLCLSHWNCWQLAWLTNLQEALICEDDVHFLPSFRKRFAQHHAELPRDWQVWYCGCLNLETTKKTMVTKHLCTLPSGYPFGTHCMLVRRSALPVLLDKCVGAYTHVDSLIAEKGLPHLKWYASYPTLARQHSADGVWPHAVGGYT